MSKFFLAQGFHQSKNDYSLFTRSVSIRFIVALSYIDDLLLAESNPYSIDILKANLHSAFTIKYLGEGRFYLDVEICRTTSGILLN